MYGRVIDGLTIKRGKSTNASFTLAEMKDKREGTNTWYPGMIVRVKVFNLDDDVSALFQSFIEKGSMFYIEGKFSVQVNDTTKKRYECVVPWLIKRRDTSSKTWELFFKREKDDDPDGGMAPAGVKPKRSV